MASTVVGNGNDKAAYEREVSAGSGVKIFNNGSLLNKL